MGKNSTKNQKADVLMPVAMRLPQSVYRRAKGEAVQWDMKMWRFVYALLVYYFSAPAEVQRSIREVAKAA